MKWNEIRKCLGVFSKRAMAGMLAAMLAGVNLAGCGAAADQAAVTNREMSELQAGQDEEKNEEVNALLDTIQKNANQSDEEQGKEETVYIFADSEGNVTSTVVSGWLKNPERLDVLTDRTDLLDVFNVKGEEAFEKNGNEYRWNANGNDIYYQGTTAKEAPVKEKITYYLDGREIPAKELAGKSGRVKVRFDYENNRRTKAEVNGKEEEIAVPFVVVTGMILNERFRNISVENGRLVSDGKNNVVIGFALPGLKDSLKLDEMDTKDFGEKIDMPDFVEVSADVEDFALDMTLTVAASSADLSFDKALDFSDLDEKMDTLTDSSAQLADGTGELADGVKTLKDSLAEFSNGVASLKDGIAEYTDGAGELADGISEVKDGAESLDEGAGALADGVHALYDGAWALKDGIDFASGGAKELRDGIDTAADGARELQDGIASAASGAERLAAGINGDEGARSGAKQLAAGAAALKTGFDGIEGDPDNPGAVEASRQVSAGIKLLVTSTQQQMSQTKTQLLEEEKKYVQMIYSAAGIPVTVSHENVRELARGLDAVVGGMIDGIQSEAAGQMSMLIVSAADTAAEAAAQKSGQESYLRGYQDGKADQEAQEEKNRIERAEKDGDAGGGTENNNGTENGSGAADNQDANDSINTEDCGKTEDDNSSESAQSDGEEESGVEDVRSDGEEESSVEDVRSGGEEEGSVEDVRSDGEEESVEDIQSAGSRQGGVSPAESPSETEAVTASYRKHAGNYGRQAPAIAAGSGKRDGYGVIALVADSDDNADGQNLSADAEQKAAAILGAASENILKIGQAQGAVMTLESMLEALGSMEASMSEMKTLTDGADSLAAGLAQLSAGADQIYAGALKLSAGMEALGSGATELTAGMGQLSSGSSALTEGMGKLSGGSSELTDGMGRLSSGGSELTDGVARLQGGSVELKEGTQKLKDGTVKLQDGAKELTGNSGALTDGAGELFDGTIKVVDGVDELYDGSEKLLAGMLEFDEEGIRKIADAYHGDVKSLSDRVKAISDAGSSYDNFCGKAEGTAGNVKFIIRTEPVK